MFRREHQERPAVERVGARGENTNMRIAIVDLEIDFRAFAATDPIPLQQLDSFGPVESPEFIDQSLGIRSDAQHPLPHRPPNDRMTAYFAPAVDYFLIRQYRAQLWAPVHRNFGDIREADRIRIGAAIRRDRLGLVRLRI